ncbi:MAG TPA: methyltransferase domain-containing protein [Gemmatimonadota bacterium]|nr:methyltransferase domain-containing protein [Gemmatimonadota bacterium]
MAQSSSEGIPAVAPIDLDVEALRHAVREEYETVARDPGRGFHFHTGRRLVGIVGYDDEWLEGIPETAIESFAGTGSPFSLGPLKPGDRVLDVGSGAGIDSLIAAKMVAPDGRVIGVDMTPAMLARARSAAAEGGFEGVEFREGVMEELPVEDEWADVVISNGVLNLTPDKPRALSEMARVLKPGGRLQIADILVDKEVSESSKQRIDLWTG